MILFVYGTLRRGERNHRRIADQTFLGLARTEPEYKRLNLGPYPGLVAGTESVAGELYQVSDCALGELDDFEGVPTLFDRRAIALIDRPPGELVQAYFWVGATPADYRPRTSFMP
ncbi:MAG: gamma-glutamylcyclotransferase family protein [Gemmataceae bacterium]